MTGTKQQLESWIVEALEDFGGSATLIDICRHVWEHHQADLAGSGDLFYTWQYDIRWSANQLRRNGTMRGVTQSPRSVWELKR